MKTIKQFLLLLSTVLALVSCKKDAVTRPVEFTETTYTTLGSYNSQGLPSGLMEDAISDSLFQFIKKTLPEGVDLTKSHPEYFSTSAIADIAITQTSEVFVTFVEQSGVYHNSLAYYTYPTGHSPASAADIKNIIYFMPHVSGTANPLTMGDKISIGTFNAGTSIGFVVMQNAWETKSSTLNNGAVHFCSNDVLNPEVDPAKKKHAVIINYVPESKVLVGFEDVDRTDPSCDNDFSDVVFYCTLTHP